MKPRWVILALAFVLTAFQAVAGNPPRPGWTKFYLVQPNATAAAPILSDIGAETLQQYDDILLGEAPIGVLGLLRARASAARIEVVDRADFDMLLLPGGIIDTRLGLIGSLPGRRPIPPPKGQEIGTWLLQFVGPPLASWMAAVRASGVTLVQYVPYNGFIVVGTAQEAQRAAQLSFVQYVDVFQPFLKSVSVQRGRLGSARVLLSVAQGPFASSEVSRIRELSDEPLITQSVGPYVHVVASVQDAAIDALVTDPLVVAISPVPALQLSDERNATAASANLDSFGNPSRRQGYGYWLAEACEFCQSLKDDNFWIGIADTGIDGGQSTGAVPLGGIPYGGGQHRADLAESRIRYGSNFDQPAYGGADPIVSSEIAYLRDTSGHGTMVAGMAGGDPPPGSQADSGLFYYGTGLAPSAGLFVTKIIPNPTFADKNGQLYRNIFDEAPDARSAGVFIQNHSRNQYRRTGTAPCAPVYDGAYSIVSQNFDAAVLDASGQSTNGAAIALTVAAGNKSEQVVSDTCSANTLLVAPPATAKNVISVGGAENARGITQQWTCMGCRADSFANIMGDSMRGTQFPLQYKPDLFAPAANVASVFTSTLSSPSSLFCNQGGNPPTLNGYVASTGTSYSAPQVAAAALLASRVYSESIAPGCGHNCSPGSAAPSLLKAMLVASARSMKGGEDRALAGPWAASHHYINGDVVRPSTPNGHYYRAENGWYGGAFTGATEPTSWPLTAGGTVTDSWYTWIEATWQASTSYQTSALAAPTSPNGHLYRATNAGATGSSEPAWPIVSSGTVIDGDITWQEAGTTTIGPLPNAQQGFGLLSLVDLLSEYPNKVYFNESSVSILTVGSTWSRSFTVQDSTRPVKVVLVWSDQPSQIGATTPLVDDLNLAIKIGTPCTTRFIGNRVDSSEFSHPYGCTESGVPWDTVNNVEMASFAGSSGTNFTVEVTGISGSYYPQPFSLVVGNAYESAQAPPPAAPSSLAAVYSPSSNDISVTWARASGAAAYEVRRKALGQPFRTIATVTDPGTLFSDASISGGLAYVYQIRAVNGTGVSPYSAPVAVAAMTFTDDPLIAAVTVVQAVHLNELRTAVNALRSAAGLSAYSFTDAQVTPGFTLIQVTHVNEIRRALEEAQTALQMPWITYSHSSLAQYDSLVSAVDFQEIRDAIK